MYSKTTTVHDVSRTQEAGTETLQVLATLATNGETVVVTMSSTSRDQAAPGTNTGRDLKIRYWRASGTISSVVLYEEPSGYAGGGVMNNVYVEAQGDDINLLVSVTDTATLDLVIKVDVERL